MSFHRSYWVKRTRKPHCCAWCDSTIKKGSAAHRGANMWEGDFCSWIMHPECSAAWDAVQKEEPEGVEFGDWGRGRTDDNTDGTPQFSADFRGENFEQFRLPELMQPAAEAKAAFGGEG